MANERPGNSLNVFFFSWLAVEFVFETVLKIMKLLTEVKEKRNCYHISPGLAIHHHSILSRNL